MTTNLFVIANVKQFRTYVVLEFYCLFFRKSWRNGLLNSAIFSNFHNRVEFGTILEGLRNFGEGGVEPPQPPIYTPLPNHCQAVKILIATECFLWGKLCMFMLSYYSDQLQPLDRHLTQFVICIKALKQLTSGNAQRTPLPDDYTPYNWVFISSFAFVSKRRC